MTIEPRQENNYIENTEKRKPTEEEWQVLVNAFAWLIKEDKKQH